MDLCEYLALIHNYNEVSSLKLEPFIELEYLLQ